jgi:hypothetical protein
MPGTSKIRETILAIAIAALIATDVAAAEPAFDERWTHVPRNEPSSVGSPINTAQIKKPKAAPQPDLPVPLQQALYLIRTTLLTLNDANRSGNYSVLRDLAATSFQEKNSAADLAVIFTNLRQRKFDLFAAALTAPQLSAPPSLEDGGKLRLTGFFPTQPLRINFDLLFENVAGQWKLLAIAVATPPANVPVAAK